MRCGSGAHAVLKVRAEELGRQEPPQPLPDGREPAALTSWLRSLPEGDGVASETQPAPTLSWETWGVWTLRRFRTPLLFPFLSAVAPGMCLPRPPLLCDLRPAPAGTPRRRREPPELRQQRGAAGCSQPGVSSSGCAARGRHKQPVAGA